MIMQLNCHTSCFSYRMLLWCNQNSYQRTAQYCSAMREGFYAPELENQTRVQSTNTQWIHKWWSKQAREATWEVCSGIGSFHIFPSFIPMNASVSFKKWKLSGFVSVFLSGTCNRLIMAFKKKKKRESWGEVRWENFFFFFFL